MEESENYIKNQTPLEIHIKVLEDISKKQEIYIRKLERKLILSNKGTHESQFEEELFQMINKPCRS